MEDSKYINDVMKAIILIIPILTLLVLIPYASALVCTFRTGSCSSGELCLFSLVQQNNSHAGDCNTYQLKVCCNTFNSSVIRTAAFCNSDESGIISLFTLTNSHVERYNLGNYNNHVCVQPNTTCSLKTSCSSSETAVVSLFAETNSHVGHPDYYSNKLCCIVVGKEINMTLSSTKVWWNDTVIVNGTVYAGNLGSSGETVTVKLDNETKCTTTTDLNGNYNCTFFAPSETGSYTVTASSATLSTSKTLEVKPKYGATPIGIADRVVYEVPMLLQEPSGKIRIAMVRVMVWRA